MLKQLTILTLFLIQISPTWSQTPPEFEWGVYIDSLQLQNNNLRNKIELDYSGNVIIWGVVNETGDFDPGPGTNIPINDGTYDGYFVKYSPSGTLIFANYLGGPNTQIIIDLDVDSLGNIYLFGEGEDSVDFDPGPGYYPLYLNNQFGEKFLAKYDSLGQFIWARKIYIPTIKACMGVDKSGNIFFASEFNGTVDFDTSPQDWTLSSDSGTTVLLKYSSQGNLFYADNLGDTINSNQVFYAFMDSSDNFHFIGRLHNYFDLDPTINISPLN